MNRLTTAAAALALSVGLALGAAPASAAPVPVPVSSGPTTRGISHPCVAVTAYGNGPGKGQFSKNYRAFDRYCDEDYKAGGVWYGPWRLKKATADHDRDVRNSQRP